MSVRLKRAYVQPEPQDGYRVLVDKLWPRGVAKADLQLDEWLQEAAPTDRLREMFHADEIGWREFRNAYLSELKHHREELRPLAERSRQRRVTLIYGAKDEEHNNAVVLKQYLAMLLKA